MLIRHNIAAGWFCAVSEDVVPCFALQYSVLIQMGY